MSTSNQNKAIIASEAPIRSKPSNYPEPFASRMKGRIKRPLGDLFGIEKFGVNLTELSPGAESALLHKHTKQEEFIYVISGHPTLVLDNEEIELSPGMCAGFSPRGGAHKLLNRTILPVVYLEMGDRIEGDEVSYPKDDIEGVMGSDGKWKFRHKDGKAY